MVKTRAEGECTFDENGYKRRAACVIFKDAQEKQVSEQNSHSSYSSLELDFSLLSLGWSNIFDF